MGREIKRVPLDFDAPRGVVWSGYLVPECRREPPEGEGWQVWETVSEGSPISPVFATAEELARHLSTVGDDWTARRIAEGRMGYTSESLPRYEDALKFVQSGWAPSMAIIGGRVLASYEAAAELCSDDATPLSQR